MYLLKPEDGELVIINFPRIHGGVQRDQTHVWRNVAADNSHCLDKAVSLRCMCVIRMPTVVLTHTTNVTLSCCSSLFRCKQVPSRGLPHRRVHQRLPGRLLSSL